jgi:hypothetical protein
MMMNIGLRTMMNFPILILIGLAVLLLVTALLQWLWNMTMPQVFNLKAITYWQAFRLLIIAGILFGSGNFSR